MHIPDGILSAPVCIAGYVATAALTHYSIRKIKINTEYNKEIPKISLMTACFFVTTLISIPVPPTSVHLVLTGIMGIIMGAYVTPSILVVLFLQATMFHQGGITTLGINTMILALPAVVCGIIFRSCCHNVHAKYTKIMEFMIGFLGVLMSISLFSFVVLMFLPSGIDKKAEYTAVGVLCLAHVPLMVIEGLITIGIVSFINKTKPEIIGGSHENKLSNKW